MTTRLARRPTRVPAGANLGVVVLVRDGREVARWPLTSADRVDVGVVDLLARLQLVARRHGCSIRLQDASEELLGLLHMCGLGVMIGDGDAASP